MANYLGHTTDGRELKCASMVIRDEGKSVGALCISIELTSFRHALNLLEDFCHTSSINGGREEESFAPDFRQLMDEMISKALREVGKDRGFMTNQEKLSVLSNLEKQGLFLVRGSVRAVSRRLGMSEPTIYKHLAKEREASSPQPSSSSKAAVLKEKG